MIEVDQLCKSYGSTKAIDNLSFSIEKGSIVGFLGANGAGKTTTMRILTGYIPATSGVARIAGYDVQKNSIAVRQRIGYLPETPPLYLNMTVREYLTFVSAIKGVEKSDQINQVSRTIDRCGLTDKKDTIIDILTKMKEETGNDMIIAFPF